ncbi:MAG TPA: TIM barrel protein [Ilumatobacteraceae bacterium]
MSWGDERMGTGVLDRLGGAPISWGVCEVPGWGLMLPAPRVLAEMSSLGLRATELGAPGFLPDDTGAVADLLAELGMTMLGGFVPLVLHDPARLGSTEAEARHVAAKFRDLGATMFVTAAVVDPEWSPRIPLDDAQWSCLIDALALVDRVVADFGLRQVLHPHVGTLVETAADVQRVLAASPVQWCLDTGHLAIGGTDPLRFARDYGDRVGHVHLKDVDMVLAARQQSGELSWMQAVQAGLFRSLGQGDVPVGDVIRQLEEDGYQGWYVLEQDQAITGDEPAPGMGPIDDARESVAYLRVAFGEHATA